MSELPHHDQYLYHLVPAHFWAQCKSSGEPYFPSTYEQDGFIHLTKDPSLLLDVANHFYKDVPGDYVVLLIDAAKLLAKVVFEPAAAVGQKQAAHKDGTVLFPHLYGTINYDSVERELAVQRSANGAFLHIETVT